MMERSFDSGMAAMEARIPPERWLGLSSSSVEESVEELGGYGDGESKLRSVNGVEDVLKAAMSNRLGDGKGSSSMNE